jgi:hypothetical protein
VSSIKVPQHFLSKCPDRYIEGDSLHTIREDQDESRYPCLLRASTGDKKSKISTLVCHTTPIQSRWLMSSQVSESLMINCLASMLVLGHYSQRVHERNAEKRKEKGGSERGQNCC